MGMMDRMMKSMMGRMSQEKKEAMMGKMMPEMMMGMMGDDKGEGGMAGMMSKMMPQMMEGMKAENMTAMMHEMMPKMMDSCFSQMTPEQRRGMLGMCRDMLDQIEKKYLPQED
jgi:hypothetical protein